MKKKLSSKYDVFIIINDPIKNDKSSKEALQPIENNVPS